MNEENLIEALNKETNRVSAVVKGEDGLYCFLTGVKLNNNWVEVTLQVELAMIGVLYSEIFNQNSGSLLLEINLYITVY